MAALRGYALAGALRKSSRPRRRRSSAARHQHGKCPARCQTELCSTSELGDSTLQNAQGMLTRAALKCWLLLTLLLACGALRPQTLSAAPASYAWFPQQIIDLPDEPPTYDIALQRDTLVVSATKLHVYNRAAAQWRASQTLTPEQANSYDGFATVLLANDTLWASSSLTLSSGVERYALHRFERSGTEFVERHPLNF